MVEATFTDRDKPNYTIAIINKTQYGELFIYNSQTSLPKQIWKIRVLKKETRLSDMPRSVLFTSNRKKSSLPDTQILLSSVTCKAFKKHSMQILGLYMKLDYCLAFLTSCLHNPQSNHTCLDLKWLPISSPVRHFACAHYWLLLYSAFPSENILDS